MSRPWFEPAALAAPTVSPGPESEEELLDAAFELAHFLHRDRQVARAICLEAMQRLEIAAAAQVKRLYYRPLRQNRFRASWGDRHLLQRLVYFHSEAWERAAESRDPGSLTEEDFLLRFLKHLCQITMKRNSFYASIALGRIVHAYSTADTMDLYHAVAPEGCERKQSDYLRSRKAQLLDEVRVRFGDLLSIVRGPHHEDRIDTREPTPEKAAWVRECLRVLTPWAIPCWGERERAPGEARRRSRFASEQDESSREARRFHALYHPPCFSTLTRIARLPDPAGRLAIPRFQVGGGPPARGGGSGEDRRAHLSPEERAEIQHRLSEEARRRREIPTRFLRVLVDGRERARIDPRSSTAARLALEETAEMIEVRASSPGGEVPLAVHALTDAPEGEPARIQVFSIELEAGQALSFRVEPAQDASRTLEVDYRETSPARRARLAARRAAWRVGETGRLAAVLARQPAALLLLAGAIGLAAFLGRAARPSPPAPPPAAARRALEPARMVAAIPDRPPATSAAPSDAPRPVAAARRRSGPSKHTSPDPSPDRVLFSLESASLLPEAQAFSRDPAQEFPATPRFADRRLPAAVETTPLQAVRDSFLDELSSPQAFTRASSGRSGPVLRDLRGAAFRAAVSASRPAAGMAPPVLSSRMESSSPRISVIRQVGPAGFADSNCRGPEPSCGVARISPAGSRPHER